MHCASDAPARILFADDDPLLRRLLPDLIRRHGYTCEAASDGADALAKMEASPFDLLLLDAMMPVLNGFEVLARMEALQWKPAVIILSARPLSVVPRTLPGGDLVRAVIDKSCGVESLMAGIADALAPAS